MFDNIDEEELRNALINYFGVAQTVNPIMMPQFLNIVNLSKKELIDLAIEYNFDLNDFIIKTK